MAVDTERPVRLNPDPTSPRAIEVDNLGVKYNLRFTKKTTLRESFSRMAKRESGEKDFWALRNVSFNITSGESLAVIGPNGAGKSTLLQVLAGILMPSEGSLIVRLTSGRTERFRAGEVTLSRESAPVG